MTVSRRHVIGGALATLGSTTLPLGEALAQAGLPANVNRGALSQAPSLAGLSSPTRDKLIDFYEAAVATKRTRINLYSANATIDPNTSLGVLLREFERTFPGLKVIGTRISNVELITKVLAEVASGNRQADIVSGPEVFIDDGLIEAFDPPTAENVNPGFRHPKGFFTASTRKLFGLVYNTDLVPAKDAPHSIDDLLQPRWKGKITFSHPFGQGTTDTVLATLLESKAIDVETLKRIAEFVPRTDRQAVASTAVNTVAQGRYAFTLWGPDQVAAVLAERGAPVAVSDFKQQVLIDSAHGLLKGGPSPDAAKLLLSWLFSPVAQKLYADIVCEYGTIPGAPIPKGLPDISGYRNVWIPASDMARLSEEHFRNTVKPIFGSAV